MGRGVVVGNGGRDGEGGSVGNGGRDGEGGSGGEGEMGVVMGTGIFAAEKGVVGIKVVRFLFCLFFKIIHLFWFLTSPMLHSDLHRSAQLINIIIYCWIALD